MDRPTASIGSIVSYVTVTRVSDAVAEIGLVFFEHETRQVHVLGHLNRVLPLPLEDQVIRGPSVCRHREENGKINEMDQWHPTVQLTADHQQGTSLSVQRVQFQVHRTRQGQ